MARKNTMDTPRIFLVDDLEKCEKDALETLAQLPEKGECEILINSGGGSVYAGLGIASMIEMRKVQATAVVLADCSSSSLLVFASCKRRFVAPHASFLFHPMQWSSEERSRLTGAMGWTREFKRIDDVCTEWVCSRLDLSRTKYNRWVRRELYITADQMVEMGLASYVPELCISRQSRKKTARREPGGRSSVKRARLAPAAGRKR